VRLGDPQSVGVVGVRGGGAVDRGPGHPPAQVPGERVGAGIVFIEALILRLLPVPYV
jgi:hypothetical protein